MNAITELASHGVYGLKPRFQELLNPVARLLVRAGVRANHITIASCVASATIGTIIAANTGSRRLLLMLSLFLFVRMALNALDGMIAREFQQESGLGIYLNELGDIISDAFCYLPFAFIPSFRPMWIGAIIIMAAISETSGILGPMARASRRYDGPMGKSDRALLFGALALWIGAVGPISAEFSLFVEIATLILLAATVLNRVSQGLAEVREHTNRETPFTVHKTRCEQERFFETHDGTRLFYRYWAAEDRSCGRAVVLLHRGHEHSGRLAHLVDELELPGFAMFAWDARGHGHSVAPEGQSPTLNTFVKDVDRFVAHISDTYNIPAENIAVVSQSVGSVLAATWVHDYAPRIRCMVLAAPAFQVKLYIPFARAALRWMYQIVGDFYVNSYVRPSALTHDPERIASYKTDCFITRPISVRVLLGLYGTSDRIVRDAQAIRVPTQVLLSSRDWVVRNKPQLEFFEGLGSTAKEKHEFRDFYHDILGERDRHVAIDKVRDFILRAFTVECDSTPVVDADSFGVTKDEFDKLSSPLPPISPKRVFYAVTKFGIKTGGRLSDGIRTGLAHGFDSGSSLDYVYRNRASGISPLGRLIDYCYLNSAGWRGIRARKQNAVRALRRAMKRLRDAGKPIRILDIAAGHGRYILDAIEHEDRVGSVLLRDHNAENVRLGGEMIRNRNLANLVRFEKGDAFDMSSMARLAPKPTLVIVSGLYELFPNNDRVRTSLAGVARAVEPGGFLIYTGQPFHPQLELIARTLSNREQRPWIMRRRTQAELDELIAQAGFRKIEQWIDDEGIFTVSIAQRTE